LLASLEHLSGATRAALGSELLRKLRREPSDSGWLCRWVDSGCASHSTGRSAA
jgi:L-amino acid N-acyltransferase YncA